MRARFNCEDASADLDRELDAVRSIVRNREAHLSLPKSEAATWSHLRLYRPGTAELDHYDKQRRRMQGIGMGT